MKRLRANYLAVFIVRMLLLFVIFGLCRVLFAWYNWSAVGPIPWGEVPSIVKGSLIFDSASIFYVNALFVFLSLVPLRLRERGWYQKMLMCIFLIFNTVGLAVNIADIYYFEFKMGRIAWDDVHLLTEGNIGTLAVSFLRDYWQGFLIWAGCVVLMWLGYPKYVPIRNMPRLRPVVFEVVQTLILCLAAGFMIFAIRGYSFSAAAYPITMSDASLYVKPKYAPLVLSNPFCVIRTFGDKTTSVRYFSDEQAEAIYPVTHRPIPVEEAAVTFDTLPNVVLLSLESFGSAHLKFFSDQFGENEVSYSPFLDSLAAQGYSFMNAFQSSLRSIDAMPAQWASIPSFKQHFLSMPGSVAQYRALPSCLVDMGYTTAFLHGSVRESMSFVSFGQAAGVERFYTREDYEAQHGSGDFDGKWGIWDHKFMPFAGERLGELPQPFFATIFTLSSHHPYKLPAGFEDRYPEGNHQMHRMIAYTDEVLRDFFAAASREPWYANTLFIITADHNGGAADGKYLQMPYAYAVPIIFYYTGGGLRGGEIFPDGRMQGRHEPVSQQIDIMPTVLRMLGYGQRFFAFGRDALNDPDAGFALNYYGSAFHYTTDSVRYEFNERELTGANRYREDYSHKEDYSRLRQIDSLTAADSLHIERMKAFVQQYYKHLNDHDFLPK